MNYDTFAERINKLAAQHARGLITSQELAFAVLAAIEQEMD